MFVSIDYGLIRPHLILRFDVQGFIPNQGEAVFDRHGALHRQRAALDKPLMPTLEATALRAVIVYTATA